MQQAKRGDVALLIGGLITAGWLVTGRMAPARADADERESATLRLWADIKDADPATYHEDRARCIEGRVIGVDKQPLRAAIRVADAIALSHGLFDAKGRGLGAFLEWPLPTELVAESDGATGRFAVDDPELGNKMIFFHARGRAPLRRNDVPVRDGLGTWGAGGELRAQHALRLVIDELPTSSEAARLRPVYAGWWPDLAWTAIEPGARVELDWRDPDGYPKLIAIERKGSIELRALPPMPETEGIEEALPPHEPAIRLSALEIWSPEPQLLAGPPDLTHDAALALLWLTGEIAAPSDPVTESSTAATIAVQADTAFAAVELIRPDGTRSSRWADGYGEVAFQGVPPGFHLVRTTVTGGAWSRWRGAGLAPGSFRRIALSPADGYQSTSSPPPVLIGFVTHGDAPSRPLQGAVVAWSGPVSGPRRPFGEVETDEHGFFRIEGVQPGAEIALRARASDRPESVATRATATVADAGVPRPAVIALPDFELHVHVPHELRETAPWLGVVRGPGSQARLATIALTARPEIVLDGMAAGDYELLLEDAEGTLARTHVRVRDGARQQIVRLADWSR